MQIRDHQKNSIVEKYPLGPNDPYCQYTEKLII
jgi:hypothetical protein